MNYKSDEQLHGDVLFQLGWDSRVKKTEVGVTVRKAVVTLTGTVDTYAKKLAAEEAAHQVPGILDVANEIRVDTPVGSRHNDVDIGAAVRHALEWNVLVPDQQTYSTVADGWVTLTGHVEFYNERVDSERAISVLPGVRGVTNKINVAVPVEPERVKFLIEDVLERRADRKAHRIRVAVVDGEVTLTGAVPTWEEKSAILSAVSHAPGVTDIHDNLLIDPYNINQEATRPR